jgi:glycine/D-amino acid oxidase-like deaminating enzyme
MTSETHDVDVVIFGGGIAGLWLLAKLRAKGYGAVLLEAGALGSGQSIASQGIIHGGTKYTLDLNVTAASTALGEMPAVWRSALEGIGHPDLSKARMTASQHHMWVPRQFAGGLMSFFATRAMRGKVDVLKDDRPAPFDDPSFDGELLALDEIVLDVPSVIAALATPHMNAIAKINWPAGVAIKKADAGGWLIDIDTVTLSAKTIVSTAGSGSQALADMLGIDGRVSQLRPLQMVMVKGAPVDLHAHCIVKHRNPRVTVTTHRAEDGERIWYIGGQVAEEGVGIPADELIASCKHEMASLLPWLDLSDTAWATHNVDRAEGWQADGRRPDFPVVTKKDDCLLAWPTKLALAPQLTQQIMAELPKPEFGAETDLSVLASLSKPPVAKAPWDEVRQWS